MMAKYQVRTLAICYFFVLQGTVLAEGPPESGFLDDYSKLQPAGAPWADYVYVTDDYYEEMTRFQAMNPGGGLAAPGFPVNNGQTKITG